ncbi:hypothetical protein FPV67DRAFT_1447013 [Lyophyllum atratum]|nr:hypothetical protein FPV67DRAFT_1447013 [Lyophyllum atratum]
MSRLHFEAAPGCTNSGLRFQDHRGLHHPNLGPFLSPPTVEPLGTIQTSFNLDDLPQRTSGWTVPDVPTNSEVVPTLQDLRKEGGYRLFKWDGITPYALLDTDARIFGLLAGVPAVPAPQHPSNNFSHDFDSRMDTLDTSDMPGLVSDDSDDGDGDDSESATSESATSESRPWSDVVTGFEHALKAVRLIGQASGTFSPVAGSHRRGNYFTLTSGISFGGGQTEPQNLVHTREEQQLIDSLLLNDHVERVAAFQSQALGYIAPRIYEDIAVHLAVLMFAGKKRDQFQANFSSSVYPAGTFNLGPETVTVLHNDGKNSRYNLCAVTVGGHFDSKRGGHLILYDLKLIIEFPRGSTILIPSALLRHGNTTQQVSQAQAAYDEALALGKVYKITFDVGRDQLHPPGPSGPPPPPPAAGAAAA